MTRPIVSSGLVHNGSWFNNLNKVAFRQSSALETAYGEHCTSTLPVLERLEPFVTSGVARLRRRPRDGSQALERRLLWRLTLVGLFATGGYRVQILGEVAVLYLVGTLGVQAVVIEDGLLALAAGTDFDAAALLERRRVHI